MEKKFKADSDTMQEKNRLAIPVYMYTEDVGHEEKNNWIEAKNGPWDGVLVFFFFFFSLFLPHDCSNTLCGFSL